LPLGVSQFIAPRLTQFALSANRNIRARTKVQLDAEASMPDTLSRGPPSAYLKLQAILAVGVEWPD
jgi:hypothetical protein